MHPIDPVLKWLQECDFGVLGHGLANHGRDYVMVVQNGGVVAPGTHELRFTHCVEMRYVTRVSDAAWTKSWSDEFTDYQRWEAAGSPPGYVWGTNWSLAYPGLNAIRDSKQAEAWSKRLGHPMYDIRIQGDRFLLGLIFHDIISRKLNDETRPVSNVVIPLPPPGGAKE